MFDSIRSHSTKPALPEPFGMPSNEAYNEEIIAEERNLEWEASRQALINETQRQCYGQLRSIQVTLAIGVANGDFSSTFRNDIKRLLIQMAAGIEVQDDN